MRIDFAKAWNIFVHNLPLFQYGIEMTLLFAFVGTFAGFVVGLLVGGIRACTIAPAAGVPAGQGRAAARCSIRASTFWISGSDFGQ